MLAVEVVVMHTSMQVGRAVVGVVVGAGVRPLALQPIRTSTPLPWDMRRKRLRCSFQAGRADHPLSPSLPPAPISSEPWSVCLATRTSAHALAHLVEQRAEDLGAQWSHGWLIMTRNNDAWTRFGVTSDGNGIHVLLHPQEDYVRIVVTCSAHTVDSQPCAAA